VTIHFVSQILTLTTRNRRAIAQVVRVTSSIITIVAIDSRLTMLTTTRANILPMNHHTTTIAQHTSLSLSLFRFYTIIIGLSSEKIQKNYFVPKSLRDKNLGTIFAAPLATSAFAARGYAHSASS
jgi:hypothetical protein